MSWAKAFLGNINKKIEAVATDAINNAASYIAENIKSEMPEVTGELRKSVEVSPARREGKDITARIFINAKYARDLDRGINTRYYGSPKMHFPLERWPQWVGRPGGAWPDKNGWFHFITVKHVISPRNFIKKGLRKSVLVPEIIKKRIEIGMR